MRKKRKDARRQVIPEGLAAAEGLAAGLALVWAHVGVDALVCAQIARLGGSWWRAGGLAKATRQTAARLHANLGEGDAAGGALVRLFARVDAGRREQVLSLREGK